MKKSGFIFVFLCTHIAFVFIQIHQYSQLIDSSYKKQKTEKLKDQLLQKKQSLTYQLCALQNKSTVKKFAQNQLHMQPIQLKQIKKMDGKTDVPHQAV